MKVSSRRRVHMKKLKRIRRHVFRREFSENQMRAYFTKDDTKKKMLMEVSLLLVPISLISGFFLPDYFFVCLCAGGIFWFVAVIIWCSMRFGIQVPTDKEYDAWVKARAREALRGELRKLNQDHLEEEI